MIRIKNNIDLTLLESYGFKKDKIYGYNYEYKNSDNLIQSDNPLLEPYSDINHVVLVDNVLYIHCNTYLPRIPDVIYQLIKDDIVEVIPDESTK